MIQKLLKGLCEIDNEQEAELVSLTKDLAPIEVAQILANELELNGLHRNILQGRIGIWSMGGDLARIIKRRLGWRYWTSWREGKFRRVTPCNGETKKLTTNGE